MRESEIPENMKRQLLRMLKTNIKIKEEGYYCKMCCAFPCFRSPGKEEQAGLCFQSTRRCRQECEFYIYKEFPAGGGFCKKDKRKVYYEQDCHIPEIRARKNIYSV
jgi:hypothetical protein